MRSALSLAVICLVAGAVPASAQHLDPTTAVKGTGVLPKDWMLRFDPPAPAETDAAARSSIVFESAGAGFRIASGPAAIYYNTKDVGKGEYSINATFAQPRSMSHEVFGLFIGGQNLQDSTQNYLYFVVRPLDGMAMISHRSSNGRPKAVRPYFATDAINKDDAKDGHATNALTIHVAKDTVHFVANGKLVAAIAKTDLDGASTDGIAGLRVNHNMDLLITDYKLKK